MATLTSRANATAGAFGNRAAVTLLGNSVYALAQFGALIVLARLTSTTDVGRYAFALALTAPIQIGFGMRLRTARVLCDPQQFSLRSYLLLGVVVGVAACVISTAAGFVLVNDKQTLCIVVLVAASKTIESLIDLSYGELQRQGAMSRIAASQIVRGLLTVSAVYVGTRIGGTVIGATIALNLVWLAQYLVWDRRRVSDGGKASLTLRRQATQVLALAATAWPLGMAAALTSFNASSPRYVVAHFMSTDELGVFAVLSYSTIVMALFANSLGQASLTGLSRAVHEHDLGVYRRLLATISVCILVCGLVCALVIKLAGRRGLLIVFGTEYAREVDVCVILIGVATVGGLATVSYYALASLGKFHTQPLLTALSSIIGIPIVVVLTAKSGLSGTAWGMLCMTSVQFLSTATVARYRAARVFART